jgi:hypothetical protein
MSFLQRDAITAPQQQVGIEAFGSLGEQIKAMLLT